MLDPLTGDIVTRGEQFIQGDNTQAEVAQTINTRLQLFTGEYFRNINEGTPWFETILDKNTSLNIRDAVIRQRILQTPGVIQIVRYDSNYDIGDRSFTVTGEVLTTQGIISINTAQAVP